MIKKIAHLADIHIRKSLERHTEYRLVFNELYKSLKKEKPDRIVVVGDIYDNFIDLEGEALILVADFLNNLSTISKVIVTVGNHDIRKKHRTRINTIETVSTLIKNNNIIYYNSTGFYEDDNIIWSVWDHVDEKNPWKEQKIRKNKDKIYIDLYHNPVYGCSLFNGMKMENKKYPKITEFKGDYSFFGDIHLRQFFKKKTKAYCGSLIQQDFGESIENHGYLLWDIINNNIKEINIYNEYKFVNIIINKNTDYDNLKIKINEKGDNIRLKVKWKDYSANINNDNERKIRNLLKNIVGSDIIKIESDPIITDINNSEQLTDSIDINDKDIQQSILKEFLINNKVNDNHINKIIELDDIINNRLNIENKISNIKWNIEKIWFNNFKSYGDNNIIDWKDKNGIIQIHGLNQQGKSTFIDAISYILYGTTLSTQKREKYGDNRFINIHRNLNFCDGGVHINVDGEIYTIYRKTTKKTKKNGKLSSVSTNIEYYKGYDMIENNKLVGERDKNTQKKLDSILGNFDDFIRLTLTNADNINDLLSMDRSIFIDNIIKDAGFDIFEKKLNEFKDYKKKLKIDKIHIDMNKIDIEINELNEKISKDKERNYQLNNNLKNNDNIIKKYQTEKEKMIFSLNKIDDDIIKIDINNTLKNIEKVKYQNNDLKSNIDIYNNYIKDITNMNLNIDSLIKELNDYEKEKNKKDNILSKYNNDIDQIKDDLSKKEIELLKKKNNIKDNVNRLNNEIKSKKIDLLNKTKILNNNLNNIKSNAKKIKNQINKLESTDNNIKICPTCFRPLDDDSQKHIDIEIIKLKKELKILSTDGIKCKTDIDENEKLIKKYEKITIKDMVEYNELLKLKTDYLNYEKNINLLKNNINILYENIKNEKENIHILTNKIKDINNKKDKYNKIIDYKLLIKDLNINILENNKEIKELNDLIIKYNNNKNYIEQNKKINEKIINISNKINTIKDDNDLIKNEIKNIDKNLLLNNNMVEHYINQINKYKEQEELDYIHNMYQKSMHRDGLPTYLLKKSIYIINNELNILLSDLDFNLFFDENLQLKMKSKIDDKTYNAIEGSGMERTFNACTLKIALRKINNISKPNIILYDEIMNKLVDKSVDEFIEFLYKLKNQIDKIIIIEHIHQMKYDYLIDVKKDKNGISSFDFY